VIQQPVEPQPLNLDEFLPDRLERQDYKLGLVISALLIPLIIASIIVLITATSIDFDENTGFLIFALCSLIATMGLGIFHMILLIKYLNNFYALATARSCIYGVIAAVVMVFAITIYLGVAEIEFTALIYIPVLILFVSQLIIGWQLARSKHDDFVGGLPSLGVVIFISAFIYPISFLIPVMACNVFSKAKDYSEKYGYKGEE